MHMHTQTGIPRPKASTIERTSASGVLSLHHVVHHPGTGRLIGDLFLNGR